MDSVTESEQIINQPEEQPEDISLSKLRFDTIKEQDIKIIFEVLIAGSDARTVADIDTITKILMHIQPIKKINNVSAVFLMGKKLALTKFKSKQIIFENTEQSQQLYIILNGKLALYRKANEYFDSDQVIFLTPGSCLGKIYNYQNHFMAITVEQTLIAVLNRKENNKIPMQLSYDRLKMLEQLTKTDVFRPFVSDTNLLQELSGDFVLNKIPLGSLIIRQNQIPKALFYVVKGFVKKSYIIKKQSGQSEKQMQTKRYTEGDFFPVYLNQPLNYNIITQSICQIIIIPKKVLRILQKQPNFNKSKLSTFFPRTITKQIGKCKLNSQFFENELKKQEQWKRYRQMVVESVIKSQRVSKKEFGFRQ